MSTAVFAPNFSFSDTYRFQNKNTLSLRITTSIMFFSVHKVLLTSGFCSITDLMQDRREIIQHTSVALVFVSSSVWISSKLSNILPWDWANSLSKASSRSFSSFLFMLVSWIRRSLCSSNSRLSNFTITLSNWSSRPCHKNNSTNDLR